MRPRDYASNFRHLRDLPSTSVNFLYSRRMFCQLLSTVLAVVGPFIIFRLFSVCPLNLPSTSVNFLCLRENFLKLSINFSCIRVAFQQFLSTFCAYAGPSVKFHLHSMRPQELPSTLQPRQHDPCSGAQTVNIWWAGSGPKAPPVARKWSGGTCGGLEVFWRHFLWARSGQNTSGGLEVVRRHLLWAGSSLEAPPVHQKGAGGTFGALELGRRHFQCTGCGPFCTFRVIVGPFMHFLQLP